MPRTFVLVPGAWHGPWCWHRIEPLLRSQGYRVQTPELPATGAETLDLWAQVLADLLAAQDEPVVLVGHSRAGVIISRAAELVPDKIALLVYLAAYLLPAGGTVAAEARADVGSLIAANMVPEQSGLTCTLRPEILREAFYGDCDAATADFAIARLRPEPLKPLVTPVQISSGNFGRVPRAYVECTRDRTVSLAAQRRMQAALPCQPVLTLESDHSPFLSHPEPLAEWLGKLERPTPPL